MSIEKAMYAAPQGLPDLDGTIEIEIVDPQEVKINGVSVMPEDPDFDQNLAEYLPEDVLVQIAGDLLEDFDSDIASRKDWIQT